MKYAKPELIVLGPATALVQGILGGKGDNPNFDTEYVMDLPLGLD
jgi:hypothetical protein